MLGQKLDIPDIGGVLVQVHVPIVAAFQILEGKPWDLFLCFFP